MSPQASLGAAGTAAATRSPRERQGALEPLQALERPLARPRARARLHLADYDSQQARLGSARPRAEHAGSGAAPPAHTHCSALAHSAGRVRRS